MHRAHPCATPGHVKILNIWLFVYIVYTMNRIVNHKTTHRYTFQYS